MSNTEKAKQILENGDYTCITVKPDGEVFTDSAKGIKPALDRLRKDKKFFLGAFVADKVVGKAAAMLFTYGGICELYTEIISVPALKWLENCNVRVEYGTLVENIKNRTNTGLCPMEQRVLDVDDHNKSFEIFDSIIK